VTDDELRLDHPLLVQWEYASEERLAARTRVYRSVAEGVTGEQVAFEAVREVLPTRVLEIGCGPGEFAERVVRELRTRVVAIDQSPRMVALARERGVDARLGDARDLPFDDASFDCVVANWVLYHVAELDRALAEVVRVLRRGGRLVASTIAPGNLEELWQLLGEESPERHVSFDGASGEETLRRFFRRVERRDARGTIVFADADAVRAFVAVTITRSHLAERVPPIDGHFRATSAHAVFVAEQPA